MAYRFSDANIVCTDRLMEKAYAGDAIDAATVTVLPHAGLDTLNFMAPIDLIFSRLSSLKARPFMICGSSNFHHLDAVNLTLHRAKAGRPLQLLLLDRHMDCQRFGSGSTSLHCGNWVSYAYREGLIDRVAMAGCNDYSRQSSFDRLPRDEGRFLYLPDFRAARLSGFLDPDLPLYLSVDTDVLDVPSDWGRGRHSLDMVMGSPLWDEIRNFKVVGAFLNGHVTDGRRLGDALMAPLRSEFSGLKGLGPADLAMDMAITFKDKLVASLAAKPLTPESQVAIMAAFHARIRGVMNQGNAPGQVAVEAPRNAPP